MSEPFETSHLTRRRFLQWFAGLTLSAGAFAGYVRVVEPRWLSIEQIEIPVLGLSPTLDGKRVAQLSDIHLSNYFSPERLHDALLQVLHIAPDWLVLTGDFVGNDAAPATALIEPLRALQIPIYAVYGNHDYWSDRSVVTRCLESANVNLLVNTSQEIESGLWLAGVDDLWSGHPDIKAAMQAVPKDAPVLLLAHEPDFFDTVLYEEAPITLQMSGHSHGGQIRIPTASPQPSGHYSYAPVLPMYGRRYPIGLREIKGRYLYTNRGLGVWPVPVRFNCRPELTVFTLRAA